MKEILQQFLPTILISYFLGFPEIQDPQNEWFIMEHVKILRGSPILGNLHRVTCVQDFAWHHFWIRLKNMSWLWPQAPLHNFCSWLQRLREGYRFWPCHCGFNVLKFHTTDSGLPHGRTMGVLPQISGQLVWYGMIQG
jgi:hypothetical protein